MSKNYETDTQKEINHGQESEKFLSQTSSNIGLRPVEEETIQEMEKLRKSQIIEITGYLLAYIAFILNMAVIFWPQWCKPIGSPLLPLIVGNLIGKRGGSLMGFESDDFNDQKATASVACLISAFIMAASSFIIDRLQIFGRSETSTNKSLSTTSSPWTFPNTIGQASTLNYIIIGSLWIFSSLLNFTALTIFTYYTKSNDEESHYSFDFFNIKETLSEHGVGTFLTCEFGVSYYSGWCGSGMMLVGGVMFMVKAWRDWY